MTSIPPVALADTLDEVSALIRAANAPSPPAPPPPPPPPMLDEAGVAMIKGFIEQEEGNKLTAYQDIGGVWTIGYGHTPASPGQTVTQAQSDMLLVSDLLKFADTILPLLTLVPGVGQYAALISLAYNIGVSAFKASTVLKMHNAGNHPAAADAFLLWDKAHVDGQLVTVPPLLARRQAERAMYLGAS